MRPTSLRSNTSQPDAIPSAEMSNSPTGLPTQPRDTRQDSAAIRMLAQHQQQQNQRPVVDMPPRPPSAPLPRSRDPSPAVRSDVTRETLSNGVTITTRRVSREGSLVSSGGSGAFTDALQRVTSAAASALGRPPRRSSINLSASHSRSNSRDANDIALSRATSGGDMRFVPQVTLPPRTATPTLELDPTLPTPEISESPTAPVKYEARNSIGNSDHAVANTSRPGGAVAHNAAAKPRPATSSSDDIVGYRPPPTPANMPRSAQPSPLPPLLVTQPSLPHLSSVAYPPGSARSELRFDGLLWNHTIQTPLSEVGGNLDTADARRGAQHRSIFNGFMTDNPLADSTPSASFGTGRGQNGSEPYVTPEMLVAPVPLTNLTPISMGPPTILAAKGHGSVFGTNGPAPLTTMLQPKLSLGRDNRTLEEIAYKVHMDTLLTPMNSDVAIMMATGGAAAGSSKAPVGSDASRGGAAQQQQQGRRDGKENVPRDASEGGGGGDDKDPQRRQAPPHYLDDYTPRKPRTATVDAATQSSPRADRNTPRVAFGSHPQDGSAPRRTPDATDPLRLSLTVLQERMLATMIPELFPDMLDDDDILSSQESRPASKVMTAENSLRNLLPGGSGSDAAAQASHAAADGTNKLAASEDVVGALGRGRDRTPVLTTNPLYQSYDPSAMPSHQRGGNWMAALPDHAVSASADVSSAVVAANAAHAAEVASSINRKPSRRVPGMASKRGAVGGSGTPLQQGAGAADGEVALTIFEPPQLPSDIADRIEILGPKMESYEKFMLWLGIALDLFAKANLINQIQKLARGHQWIWFVSLLFFLLLSSAMGTFYWWTHYTFDRIQKRTQREHVSFGRDAEVRRHTRFLRWTFNLTKATRKALLRFVGSFCAFTQLGTVFAALRSLFSSDLRQRQAQMDLKGMRLVDCTFLTMGMALLQAYIGMSCSSPNNKCSGYNGFTPLLVVACAASVLSAALAHLQMDLNVVRIEQERKRKEARHHTTWAVTFFTFRSLEVSARTFTLALFTTLYGAWVLLVLVAHMMLVTAAVMIRRFAWSKLSKTKNSPLVMRRMKLPRADDVKLIFMQLSWPPSCYVSDATDAQGRFWWRSRGCARRRFSYLGFDHSLISFPIYTTIFCIEAATMLVLCYLRAAAWNNYFILAALGLNFGYVVSAAVYSSSSYAYDLNAMKTLIVGQEQVLGGAVAPGAGGVPATGDPTTPATDFPRQRVTKRQLIQSIKGRLQDALQRNQGGFYQAGGGAQHEAMAPQSDGRPGGAQEMAHLMSARHAAAPLGPLSAGAVEVRTNGKLDTLKRFSRLERLDDPFGGAMPRTMMMNPMAMGAAPPPPPPPPTSAKLQRESSFEMGPLDVSPDIETGGRTVPMMPSRPQSTQPLLPALASSSTQPSRPTMKSSAPVREDEIRLALPSIYSENTTPTLGIKTKSVTRPQQAAASAPAPPPLQPLASFAGPPLAKQSSMGNVFQRQPLQPANQLPRGPGAFGGQLAKLGQSTAAPPSATDDPQGALARKLFN